MSEINEELVRHIAHLARLHMGDDQIHTMSGELSQIVAFVDQLSEVDTADVEPTAHALPLNNVLRDDEIRPSIKQSAALSNAPESENGFFRVPKVLDNEGDA